MSDFIKRCFIYLPLFLLISACHSFGFEKMPSWIKVHSFGAFEIDKNIEGKVLHYDEKWKLSSQSARALRSQVRNGNGLKAKWTLRNGQVFQFDESAIPSDDEINYKTILKSTSGNINTNQLCLSLNLPVSVFAKKNIEIDGTKIPLPENNGKLTLSSGKAATISVPVSQGKLEITSSGKLSYLIQDNRRFKSSSFSLRLFFSPSKGAISESSLNVKFRVTPVDAKAISLKSEVNRGFADDISGDGKGGWTDQGPENDLRMLKSGHVKYSGIPFEIINSNQNAGKSCIVISDGRGKNLPVEKTVNFNGDSFNYLYLLHSAAWANKADTYGIINVKFADGSEDLVHVKGGRDVADWWRTSPRPNAAVVWTAENQSSYVGLYMSRFAVKNKPISNIVLKSLGKSMWMIVGITGVNDDIPLPVKQAEFYVVENNDWKPFKHSLDVVKGSALDMSFLVDAPAGKHGRVKINNAHFVFEDAPQTPVRFYGSNLCFSANYLEKKDCEKLSENFARFGYNSVRIHHHDQGMIDASAPDSLTLDKKQMDKLDYLFYCMKKHGIYITTDIYVSRRLKPTETGIYKEPSRRIKALVPTSKLVMDNIKAFAKTWLEHVNPYTGQTWKDDPALFSVSFVNENTMYSVWQRTPEVKAVYEKELLAWVRQNNIPYNTDKEKEAAMYRFSTDMQIRSYEEMKEYVTNTLDCKAVYSDCNMQAYRAQQLARDHFDYVDNHGYWDHPRFPVRDWALPFGFQNMSVIKRYCEMPARQMPSRIFGKPFTFTEYNYVFPNVYRSEGGPVMGAYASLQGWDAVYRFAFAHSDKNAISVQPATGFDTATDPLALLGERIAALLFLRGDVSSAKSEIPFVMTENITSIPGSGTNSNGFSSDLSKIGLIHKVGTVIAKKNESLSKDSLFCIGAENLDSRQTGKLPFYKDDDKLLENLVKNGRLKSEEYQAKQNIFKSDTGEIALQPSVNKLAITTPRSECMVIPAGNNSKGKVLSVKNCSTYSTVFAGSIDGKDLANTSRILLLHLTDIKNTQTKFSNENMTLLEKIGTLPHLVKKGSARIELNTSHNDVPTVWALDITGKRLGEIDWTDNGFTADTFGKFGGVMAYEIVWQ